MIIFKTIKDIKEYLAFQRNNAVKIGFIPTMGALHQGHISLVDEARKVNAFTVCSIFVNPAQFNDSSDFDKYPSTVNEDILLLEKAQCDVLFLPSVSEIYPEGSAHTKDYHFGTLETVFEGAMRPGHFNGVGKVVAILLQIIQPNLLFMGSKDFQQCLVVQDLCKQMGINNSTKFVACATQREPDGLAMSSRNRRLNESQRAIAGIIYQCLVSIQGKALIGASFAIVKKECIDLLTAKNIHPEYISIANADTLEELSEYDLRIKMVVLIAARLGDIRLIDNLVINP
ncbi:MAG: pantoate--beta-alanine ligase [Chitinophagaceae bacterium]|nr:pantoate--beta-alanine ligase [Chitinophagaceae bacterium]